MVIKVHVCSACFVCVLCVWSCVLCVYVLCVLCTLCVCSACFVFVFVLGPRSLVVDERVCVPDVLE